MARGTLRSVSEYLTTSYRPDRELVDGVVLERNVGERDHSELQMALSAYLYNQRVEWGIHVYPKQRVQVSASRFRVPDICVVAGRKPSESILTDPPFLCIEILSKDDRLREVQGRVQDYLSFGVRYVWVIDPKSRTAQIHTATGSREIPDGILKTDDPRIEVPMAEIYALL